MSDLYDPIGEIKQRIKRIESARVTYRAATVTAVDAVASTFDADVEGAGVTTGLSAEPSFLPAVGDQVRLTLVGAKPIYQPHRIGAEAVGTGEIAALAVTNPKVGSVDVAKVTAGTVNADWIIAGQIATGTSGQRAGINSLGLFAYNSAGTKTVDLNGVSNLLTGTLQTALTGRRIVTGASGTTGEITFYPASGTATSYVRSFTEGGGVEALQVGLTSGQASDSPLWNRLNINSDEWTNLRSNKIDLNYLNGGVFVVRQLSSRNTSATATTRVQIDASSSLFFAPDNATVYQVSNGAHTFYPASSATSGWVKIKPNLISDSNFRTPYIEFATDNNGVSGAGAYTSLIKFIVRTGGTNPAFQFRTGDDSAYQTIEAANVTGSSSMKVKTDYEDFNGDPLSMLRPIKLRKFRRIGQDPATPKELGVFAEEVPAEMGTNPGDDGRPTMVTFLPSIALLIGAVQQLADRIDKLEKNP